MNTREIGRYLQHYSPCSLMRLDGSTKCSCGLDEAMQSFMPIDDLICKELESFISKAGCHLEVELALRCFAAHIISSPNLPTVKENLQVRGGGNSVVKERLTTKGKCEKCDGRGYTHEANGLEEMEQVPCDCVKTQQPKSCAQCKDKSNCKLCIYRHPIITKLYELAQQIEKCGCSENLTTAVSMIEPIQKLVDELIKTTEPKTCMCMDCGKRMLVSEQIKHLSECPAKKNIEVKE